MPIRPARASDVPAIRRCVHDAYAVYEARLDRPPAPVLDDYAAQVRARTVYVDRTGELRGVVVLEARVDHLLVRNLAVRPEFQGRGIGRSLLDFAERKARALGLGELRLATNERMTENLAYYPKRGFREVGRGVEDGYDRVFFSKSVRAPSRTRKRRRAAARAAR